MDYLKKVLKMSAGLGATGVLMEYEDMFPFTGKLGKAAAANHYSAGEVKELLEECQALGLTVIPLVQTFGEWQTIHMDSFMVHHRSNTVLLLVNICFHANH